MGFLSSLFPSRKNDKKRSVSGTACRRQRPSTLNRSRLVIEPLERRELLTVLYWDPDGNSGNNNLTTGAGLGSTGTYSWTTSGAWVNASNQRCDWSSGAEAVFWGAAGTVNVNTAVSAAKVGFQTGGYTIGGTNTLTLTGATAIDAQQSATISASLAIGASELWTVTSGKTLSVSSTVGLGSYTLTVQGGGNTTASGAISGTGALAKSGTGTLTLSGANGYSGGTTISAGTLTLSGGDNRLSTTGTITLQGGTLDLGNHNQTTSGVLTFQGTSQSYVQGGGANGKLTLTRGNRALVVTENATINADVVCLSGNDYNEWAIAAGKTLSIAGDVDFTDQSLFVGGPGTIALSGDSYVGNAFAIFGGGTSVFDSGNFTVSVVILGGSGSGTLHWNSSGTLNASFLAYGALGGAGIVTQSAGIVACDLEFLSTGDVYNLNGGALQVSGINMSPDFPEVPANCVLNFSGGTLNAAGNLSPSSGLSYTIAAGKTATIDTNGNSVALAGAISGSGALTKIGTGTLTLSGSNSYSGGTTISAGTLALSGGDNRLSTTGAITLQGGTLDLGNHNQTTSGVLTFQNAAGSIVQNGTLTLTTSDNPIVATESATINAKIVTDSIYDAGVWTIAGGKTLTIGGEVDFSDQTLCVVGPGTVVFSGTSYIGETFWVLGGGTTIFNSGDLTVSGVLVGGGSTSGTLIWNSSGTMNAVTLQYGFFSNGNGIVTQTAGTVVCDLEFQTTGNVYNLDGGTLHASGVNSSSTPVGTVPAGCALNFGGGTLQATGNLNPSNGLSYTIAATKTATIDTNGYNVTVAGAISGTGSLAKCGTGTLTLSGSNSYSGGTTISAGTLALSGGDNRLATNGAITLQSGTLDLGNHNQTTSGLLTFQGASQSYVQGGGENGKLTLTGADTTMVVNQSVTISADIVSITDEEIVEWNIATGQTLAIEGDMEFSGVSLFVNGPGTITLSGESYVGNVFEILGGGTANFTSGDLTALVVIGGTTNCTLNWDSEGYLNAGAILFGIGDGAGVFTQSDGYVVCDLEFLAEGHVYNLNGGSLNVSGVNTFFPSWLPEVPDNCVVNFNGGTFKATGNLSPGDGLSYTIAATKTATIDTNGYTVTLAGPVSGGGGLTKTGSGTLTLTNANSYSGGTTINAGTLALTGGENRLATTGAITLGGGTLDLGNHNQTTSGLLTFQGASQSYVQAGGANGKLTLPRAGTAMVVNQNAEINADIMSGSSVATWTVAAGKTLTIGGDVDFTDNTLFVEGPGTTVFSGTSYVGQTFWVHSGGTAVFDSGDLAALLVVVGGSSNDGNVIWNSSGALNATGLLYNVLVGGGTTVTQTAGTVTCDIEFLTAGDVYNLNGGTLQVPAINSTVNPAGTVPAGCALNFGGGTLKATGNLNPSNGLSYTIAVGQFATIDTNGYNVTLNGSISGGGGLTKTGSGMLTLTGTNTYSGATAVSAGELRIAGSITSAATVAAGATLSGAGTTGAVTANGTVSPGVGGVDTLDTGSLTFVTGSSYSVDLTDVGADQIDVIGAVALGNATLSISSSRAAHQGDVLVLIKNDGSEDAVGGTFAGLAEGSEVVAGGVRYYITYTYNAETGIGTGNDVALVDNSGAPVVVTPLSAVLGSSGTDVTLSVLASDNMGYSNLTYTWAVTKDGEAYNYLPFSGSQGSDGTYTAVANLTAVGDYVFTVTIIDSDDLSVTSSASLTVAQILTSILIDTSENNEPTTVTVGDDECTLPANPAPDGPVTVDAGAGPVQLIARARDQFGGDMVETPTFIWSTTGGSISSTGQFSAPEQACDPVLVTVRVANATESTYDDPSAELAIIITDPSPTTSLRVGVSSDASVWEKGLGVPNSTLQQQHLSELLGTAVITLNATYTGGYQIDVVDSAAPAVFTLYSTTEIDAVIASDPVTTTGTWTADGITYSVVDVTTTGSTDPLNPSHVTLVYDENTGEWTYVEDFTRTYIVTTTNSNTNAPVLYVEGSYHYVFTASGDAGGTNYLNCVVTATSEGHVVIDDDFDYDHDYDYCVGSSIPIGDEDGPAVPVFGVYQQSTTNTDTITLSGRSGTGTTTFSCKGAGDTSSTGITGRGRIAGDVTTDYDYSYAYAADGTITSGTANTGFDRDRDSSYQGTGVFAGCSGQYDVSGKNSASSGLSAGGTWTTTSNVSDPSKPTIITICYPSITTTIKPDGSIEIVEHTFAYECRWTWSLTIAYREYFYMGSEVDSTCTFDRYVSFDQRDAVRTYADGVWSVSGSGLSMTEVDDFDSSSEIGAGWDAPGHYGYQEGDFETVNNARFTDAKNVRIESYQPVVGERDWALTGGETFAYSTMNAIWMETEEGPGCYYSKLDLQSELTLTHTRSNANGAIVMSKSGTIETDTGNKIFYCVDYSEFQTWAGVRTSGTSTPPDFTSSSLVNQVSGTLDGVVVYNLILTDSLGPWWDPWTYYYIILPQSRALLVDGDSNGASALALGVPSGDDDRLSESEAVDQVFTDERFSAFADIDFDASDFATGLQGATV
jgi:autotransporter-associated beta strand protein